ncbi:MAG: J domain-containing protein, partial [Treponema sp.]|nr:J domain-containing protein [Treponema sp.]
ILAEELEKRQCYYDAFVLLVELMREERRRPYFKHFTSEIETVLKELARLRLKLVVDENTYIVCMENLLGLGFPPRDEARWLCCIAETFLQLGERDAAQKVFHEAAQRDPGLRKVAWLRRKLRF